MSPAFLLVSLLALSSPPSGPVSRERCQADLAADIAYGRTCLHEAVQQKERLPVGEAVTCIDYALCYDALEHGGDDVSFVACLDEHAARRQRVALAEAQFDAPAAKMDLTREAFWRAYGVTPSRMAGVFVQASRRAACWRQRDYGCLFFAKLEEGRYGIDYMLPDIEANVAISQVMGQLRYAIEPL